MGGPALELSSVESGTELIDMAVGGTAWLGSGDFPPRDKVGTINGVLAHPLVPEPEALRIELLALILPVKSRGPDARGLGLMEGLRLESRAAFEKVWRS